jgi:hypothetical protein
MVSDRQTVFAPYQIVRQAGAGSVPADDRVM